MPHITLEYSSNLKVTKENFPFFFSNLHQALVDHLGVNILNCKSRAVRLKNYYIADGDKDHAFAHLEIKILEGHNRVGVDLAGEMAMKLLRNFFEMVTDGLVFQPSVEIVEIPKTNYFKISAEEIIGTKRPL